MIAELEAELPDQHSGNFRQRLLLSAEPLEQEGVQGNSKAGETLLKIGVLLITYDRHFGAIDIFNNLEKSALFPLQQGNNQAR